MTETNPPVPSIGLISQYLKDFSFENLAAGKLARGLLKPMAIDLRASIEINDLGNSVHETELFLALTGRIDSETVFIAEITYAASHRMINLDPDLARNFLNVEVARNIFPYAAAILSQTAAGAGLPPVWLDPVDFTALYNARRQDEARAAASRSATS